MPFVYELVIDREEYGEEELEMLFATPQAAYEFALRWNEADETRPPLPPLGEWERTNFGDGGFKLQLTEWCEDLRLRIILRKIHDSA